MGGKGGEGKEKSVAFKRHLSLSLTISISSSAKSHRKKKSGGLLPLHKTNGQNPLSPSLLFSFSPSGGKYQLQRSSKESLLFFLSLFFYLPV